MGLIPRQFIDDLLTRIDIVEVIDARVPLKKAGREFQACCPFHNEKTPSFTVSPTKQFYHCFGCGAHGTAIGFLMEYENMDFVEAVEELARSLGLEVPRESGPGPARERSATELYDLLDQAAAFYRRQLREHPAAGKAVEYLKQRGLSGEIARDFGIGYAPPGWDNLFRALAGTPEREKALHTVGLLAARDSGGSYDRFRDRIMFPIRDRRGRVIGFGGRVLGDDTPKYLNSPETPLFHKGRALYGLFEARKAVRQLERLLVVEGYMDVVALAQFGIRNVVATLGTATTRDHLEQLYRIVPEVVFCFDGDRSGRAAAWRALENALPVMREGRQARFLFLPEGEDPDSLVRREGKTRFEERIAESIPFSEFLLEGLAGQVDISTVDGRARLAELARPLMSKLPEGVFRELMMERLATAVQMPPDRLRNFLGAGETQQPPVPPPPPASPGETGRRPVREAIALLLHDPSLAASVDQPRRLQGLRLAGVQLLIELLEIAKNQPHTTHTGALLEHFRGRDEERHLWRLAQMPVQTPADAMADEFRGLIALLEQQCREQRWETLQDKLTREGRLTEAEMNEWRELLRQQTRAT